METAYIFKRIERKYLLDEVTKKRLLQRMKGELLLDEYGKSTICSLYLDTPDHRIIRSSIDAGAYKEKLRLRSYGTPQGRFDRIPGAEEKNTRAWFTSAGSACPFPLQSCT